MFNLSGSEIVVVLLLALIVLGPEKLPDAMRRAGKAFAEIKKLSSGFQDEVRKGFDEPIREVKQTAATVKSAARFPPVGAKATTVDKPRYNPETDPTPEPPEGSSVASPLAETSPDAAEAAGPAASDEHGDSDVSAAADEATGDVADEIMPVESPTTVEADRTA